ncbi:MAG: hypothetical protein LBI17_03785 [Rickettsiales bacterium]|nr:hypothetical protein [Rickettsiales bacterium]
MRLRNTILLIALLLPATARAAKVCLPCLAGTYSDSGTEGKCKACDKDGEYQDQVGKSECKKCTGTNMKPVEDRTSCQCVKPAIDQSSYSAGDIELDWKCADGNNLDANGGLCYCRASACGAWSSWAYTGHDARYDGCGSNTECNVRQCSSWCASRCAVAVSENPSNPWPGFVWGARARW